MKKLLSNLTPSFMKRLDKYLLTQQPSLWTSRLHWVLFWWVIATGAIGVISYFSVADALYSDTDSFHVAIAVIIAVIGFIVYLIYYLRHNLFKSYSVLHSRWQSMGVLLGNWLTVFLFSTICFLPKLMSTIRANKQYPDAQLIQDANTANLLAYQNNKDALREKWDSVLVELTTDKYDNLLKQYEYDYSEQGENKITDSFYKYVHEWTDNSGTDGDDDDKKRALCLSDSLKLYSSKFDSTRIVDNKHVVVYNAPDVTLLRGSYRYYEYNADGTLKQKTDMTPELSNYDIITASKLNIASQIAKDSVLKILNKYITKEDIEEENRNRQNEIEYIEKGYVRSNYKDSMEKIFPRLEYASDNLHNVQRNKTNFYRDSYFLFASLFVFSFYVALLIFIFRHSNLKIMGLSVLIGFVLFVITAFSMYFFRQFDSEAEMMSIAAIEIIAVGLLGALLLRKSKSTISAIAITIFTAVSGVLPILAIGLYAAIWRHLHNNSYFEKGVFFEKAYFPYYSILAALLTVTLYSIPSYKQWYAKPQK